MSTTLRHQARPASPGVPGVALALVLGVLATACTEDAPAGVPPAPNAAEPTHVELGPPPTDDPDTTDLGTVDPIPGSRERQVRWRLVHPAGGRVIVIQAQAGGPPCDAITGLTVVESSSRVEITVWAGRAPNAQCVGVPAVLATFRVRVPLDQPLGSRMVRPAPPS
ncbi:MAG: hypothetical protein ACRCYU_19545 [Nocardioides sp.]